MCAQGGKTTDKYYKIFTSTVDTVNANGGTAGLHLSVFKKYFASVEARELEKRGNELSKLTPAELKVVEEEEILTAKEAAPGEYLTCLFLLLADDERYEPLNLQLDNNFLMGEQEYPSSVLTAQQLMMDFVPTTSAVKHKRKEMGPLDVAFVETNTNLRSICYCCGEQHPGGYRKCLNMMKAVQ